MVVLVRSSCLNNTVSHEPKRFARRKTCVEGYQCVSYGMQLCVLEKNSLCLGKYKTASIFVGIAASELRLHIMMYFLQLYKFYLESFLIKSIKSHTRSKWPWTVRVDGSRCNPSKGFYPSPADGVMYFGVTKIRKNAVSRLVFEMCDLEFFSEVKLTQNCSYLQKVTDRYWRKPGHL